MRTHWNHLALLSQEDFSFLTEIEGRAELDKRNDAALDDS